MVSKLGLEWLIALQQSVSRCQSELKPEVGLGTLGMAFLILFKMHVFPSMLTYLDFSTIKKNKENKKINSYLTANKTHSYLLLL